MTCLPASAAPGPEAALTADPGPGEVLVLLPAVPEFVELPFRQTPIPAMETSGQRPQNSTSAGPPRLYPPLLLNTDGKGEENTALDRGCAPLRSMGKESQYRCPSETYNSLQFRTHEALPSVPCEPIITSRFLYGCIKLAETWSTLLGGGVGHKPKLG